MTAETKDSVAFFEALAASSKAERLLRNYKESSGDWYDHDWLRFREGAIYEGRIEDVCWSERGAMVLIGNTVVSLDHKALRAAFEDFCPAIGTHVRIHCRDRGGRGAGYRYNVTFTPPDV